MCVHVYAWARMYERECIRRCVCACVIFIPLYKNVVALSHYLCNFVNDALFLGSHKYKQVYVSCRSA